MKSRHITVPEKKKNKVSVPFQNGTHDFSTIYGSQAYEERELNYVFQIRGRNTRDMEGKQQQVLNWLLNSQKQVLQDDYLPGLYFMAECEVAEPDDLNFILDLSVTFMAYPFKYGEHTEGSDIWDTFNFLTDYAQVTKFNITGSKRITLWNPGSTPVSPSIIASSNMEIIKSGVSYSISKGESNDWKFLLDIGENNMNVTGNGSIEFIFRKEVI